MATALELNIVPALGGELEGKERSLMWPMGSIAAACIPLHRDWGAQAVHLRSRVASGAC